MVFLRAVLMALPHLIIFVLSETSLSHETSESHESSEEDLTIIESDFELSSNRRSFMPEVYRSAKVNTPKPVYNMSCKCGQGRIGEIRNSSGTPRIVNGYVPETRPWMAYIQIYHKDGRGTCGGSLINKRWVLSAGHCFCTVLPCKRVNKNTVIGFNATEHVKCVIGLKDVSLTLRYSDGHLFDVLDVIIHPRYMPVEHDQSDLALIKLVRDVTFSDNAMPICLPGSNMFPDTSGFVYVAGWGSTAESMCTTGEYGPDPYTKCTSPFAYLGMTISNCVNIPSPSATDKLCSQLVKQKKLNPFPSRGYTQTNIYDEKGKLLTECFSYPGNPAGQYGWCATCQRDAKPGQPGYCGANPTHSEKERGKPKATKAWGYCQKQCEPFYLKNAPAQTMLQEVKLEVLSQPQCKKMGTSMKVMTNIEICAAKQVFRRKDGYVAVKSKDNKTFDFNQVPPAKRTRDVSFQFGGQDACTGDSGGPLWKWMGRETPKATIIGVVSRGKGCARKDAPGIYTRTKKFLAWIFTHAKDGKC